MMNHYDIYRDQLSITHPSFGHALWEPAPEGEYGPVKVGDVGYVREGKFFRLFNALLPADHPSHKDTRIPEYHEPLVPNIPNHIFGQTRKPNHYCSAGVNAEPAKPDYLSQGPPEFTEASFSCRRRRVGAVLALPVEAHRQDTRAREDFGKWMLKHIDCWYAFARGLGLGIERMEEIILVTGCDCTRSWANIAFLDGHPQKMALFGFKVIQGHGNVGIYWQFLPGNSQGAVCNWGPEGQNLREDQCVFLRGFRVVRVLGILPKQLKGAAGPNPSPDEDDEPNRELMSIPASTKYRDPLNVLLDYVVERAPDSDLVLVHDDDLSRIGRFHDGNEALQPDSLMAHLQRTQPDIQQIPYDCPPKTASNSTITVAMFSKELQEWGPTPPQPSTVGLGQSGAYQPDQLIDQVPGSNEFSPPYTVGARLSSVNDRSCKIISQATTLANVPPRRRMLAVANPDSESDDNDIEGLSADPNVPQLLRPSPTVSSLLQPTHSHYPLSLGACRYCKRVKMKCVYSPGENVCKRCKLNSHDCTVEMRKPRASNALINRPRRPMTSFFKTPGQTLPRVLNFTRNEERSSLLFSERHNLLAQLKQEELIDSPLTQLQNPYLVTPLSIEAYRARTSLTDQHQQSFTVWFDGLQSSVHSSPMHPDPTTNTFPLNARAGKSSGQSDESKEERASKKHTHSSLGWEEPPTSCSTLVEPDIDPYPDDAVPIGLLANLAITTPREVTGAAGDKAREKNVIGEDDEVGVARKTYFMPVSAWNLGLRKSLSDKTSPPEILIHKLVTPDDVDVLFKIFFTRINPFISLLEPKLHSPAQTFSRSPLLFTVVCAIALRYSDKHDVYPIAMQLAKSSAGNAIIGGQKSVELCQAYILMSHYDVRMRRSEGDRKWLYTGLAIQIATDMNLHRLSPKRQTTEQDDLELLNRTRTWIDCFNLDKSTATQFGKPSTLKADNTVRNTPGWYKSSKYNHPYDIHTAAYTWPFRIVNQFQAFLGPNVPSGLNRWIDWRTVTLEHDRMLLKYCQEWTERFERDSDHTNAACEFRIKLLPFHTNYARLVVFSLGFEKTFKRGTEIDDEVFFAKSLESAKAVVTILIDSLVPTGYMRFAPDSYFAMSMFAAVAMLKLLHPECWRFITRELEAEIYQVIERLINTIGSPQIAIDERHTPKLYSRFLASLLAKYKRENRDMYQQGPQLPTSPSVPAYQQPQQQAPSMRYSNAGSFATDVNSASTPYFPQPMAQDHDVKAPHEFVDSIPANESGPSIVGASQDFTFGDKGPYGEVMDFTFDPSTTFGNEDAAMQPIQNPTWWSTMMMPGFSWPTEEQIQDHFGFPGGDMPSMNLKHDPIRVSEIFGSEFD